MGLNNAISFNIFFPKKTPELGRNKREKSNVLHTGFVISCNSLLYPLEWTRFTDFRCRNAQEEIQVGQLILG